MRTADLITASVLMLVGGVVVLDAVRLGFGWGADGPKSGFFPFWLAVIMIASCAIVIVQAYRRVDDHPFVTREKIGPVLKVLWPAVAMVVLTHFVGLYVAGALYTAFYMKWVGRHSWLASITLSVAISVLCFVTFELWFLVPMPKGPLEAWLGY